MEMTQLRCIIHNLWPEVESVLAGQDNEGVKEGCRRICTLDLLSGFVNATGFGRGETIHRIK